MEDLWILPQTLGAVELNTDGRMQSGRSDNSSSSSANIWKGLPMNPVVPPWMTLGIGITFSFNLDANYHMWLQLLLFSVGYLDRLGEVNLRLYCNSVLTPHSWNGLHHQTAKIFTGFWCNEIRLDYLRYSLVHVMSKRSGHIQPDNGANTAQPLVIVFMNPFPDGLVVKGVIIPFLKEPACAVDPLSGMTEVLFSLAYFQSLSSESDLFCFSLHLTEKCASKCALI